MTLTMKMMMVMMMTMVMILVTVMNKEQTFHNLFLDHLLKIEDHDVVVL